MKTILLLLLISCTGFGQTKSETEEWIISKYLYYKLDNPVHKNNILKIENGIFIHIKSYGYFEKIQIKNIGQVKVSYYKVENREGYTISFYCKNKLNCIEEGKYENGQFLSEKKKLNYFFSLYVNTSFGKEDLPKRMEKAILHLIKLYGGNATIYKETF